SSFEIAECPVDGIARTLALGYWLAARRASSSGVRRSSRPEMTRTGTSGPGPPVGAGAGVEGHDRHGTAALSAATSVRENGAKSLAGRDSSAAASARGR